MKNFSKNITKGMFNFVLSFSAIAVLLGVSAFNISAEILYANTVSNDLVRFDSANPCEILSSVSITGLQEDEKLLAIDFRPATNQLYGLGSTSRIYTIDTITGVATAVGTAPFSPALEGSSFGFDFNPTVDRIRIVSDTGQNLRVNPNTGAVVVNPATGAVTGIDTPLAYASTDVNFGTQPNVVGAAYTNPDNDTALGINATGTTLYDLDSNLDILTTQVPPNAGTLNTVGSLGISVNDLVGFDISSSNTAYAALKVSGKDKEKGKKCGNSTLVTIELITGKATSLGNIGTQQPILGLAAELTTIAQ